jgi:predicted Zn finger-like uncharacterized protein
MLVTCPACTTNFSVPDSALGTEGRKLKCAKCGHKWHQRPLMVMEEEDDTDLDLSGPSFAADPAPEPRRREPHFDENPFREREPEPEPQRPSQFQSEPDLDMDAPPVPDFGPRIAPERQFGGAEDTLLDDEPQPIPDVFATSEGKGKKGTGLLWLLLVLLILGGLGGAGYYFQDMVVDLVPEAGEVLAQAGLRHEKPGAGLELRKAGTPERFVHNDTDMLVVRGIIANVTDRVRPVPTMKLVLLDKNKQPVQEKLSQAPASALDPQGTVSFKILLERPDPNAVEVLVVFVEGPEAAKAAPPPPPAAPKMMAPPPTPDVAPPAEVKPAEAAPEAAKPAEPAK